MPQCAIDVSTGHDPDTDTAGPESPKQTQRTEASEAASSQRSTPPAARWLADIGSLYMHLHACRWSARHYHRIRLPYGQPTCCEQENPAYVRAAPFKVIRAGHGEDGPVGDCPLAAATASARCPRSIFSKIWPCAASAASSSLIRKDLTRATSLAATGLRGSLSLAHASETAPRET